MGAVLGIAASQHCTSFRHHEKMLVHLPSQFLQRYSLPQFRPVSPDGNYLP
jgi:hypothetical protein